MKYYYRISMFITMLLSTVFVFAQDKGLDVDIDINKKEDLWYRQPWVWVVAAAVFILLLAAILKRDRK